MNTSTAYWCVSDVKAISNVIERLDLTQASPSNDKNGSRDNEHHRNYYVGS